MKSDTDDLFWAGACVGVVLSTILFLIFVV